MIDLKSVLISILILSTTGHVIHRRGTSMDDGIIIFRDYEESDIIPVTARSHNLSLRSPSVDEDNIIFRDEDETTPSLTDRILLDAPPNQCKEGEKLGKDRRCRTVW